MEVNVSPSVDLAAYFERIGYTGNVAPRAETLAALHLAHATHIPFENLDVLLGQPILLDSKSLQQKLIRQRRGGYCFEQNSLLAIVLEQLGFCVTRLMARVCRGTNRQTPRTHMLLMVDIDGQRWLVDVGFGGWGPLQPLLLEPSHEARQFAWSYRVAADEEPGWYTLQARMPTGWQDLYRFSLESYLPEDFLIPNHFCATHPDSRFMQTLTVQLPAPEVRYILRNRDFVTATPDEEVARFIEEDRELRHLLRDQFGLVVAAESSLPTGSAVAAPANDWRSILLANPS